MGQNTYEPAWDRSAIVTYMQLYINGSNGKGCKKKVLSYFDKTLLTVC